MLPSVHGLGLSGSLGYSIRGREDESNCKPEMQSWETYASLRASSVCERKDAQSDDTGSKLRQVLLG